MKLILRALAPFALLTLAACGGDDCAACAQAAADAHEQVSYENNTVNISCTSEGSTQSFSTSTDTCEATILGMEFRVNAFIKDSLTACGLSVPSQCN